MRSILRVIQGWVKLKGATDGTFIGNVSDALKVSITNTFQPVLNFLHWKIHEGEVFSINAATTYALNDEINFIFEPDSEKDVHLVYQLSASDDVEAKLFEGTTYTGGTVVPTVYNRNRKSTTTYDATIKYLVTITADGTQLEGFLGGANGGDKTTDTGTKQEWILKRGLTYCLRFKSLAPGNEITTDILFYESSF